MGFISTNRSGARSARDGLRRVMEPALWCTATLPVVRTSGYSVPASSARPVLDWGYQRPTILKFEACRVQNGSTRVICARARPDEASNTQALTSYSFVGRNQSVDLQERRQHRDNRNSGPCFLLSCKRSPDRSWPLLEVLWHGWTTGRSFPLMCRSLLSQPTRLQEEPRLPAGLWRS